MARAPGLSENCGFDRFWLRAIKVSCPAAQTRFIASFSEYVYAVIDEASDRAKGHIRGIEDYLKLTRLTAGGYPAFVAVEAGLNVPNDVMAHPALESLRSLAAESLVLTNVSSLFAGLSRAHISDFVRIRICTRLISSKLRAMAATTSLPSS